MDCPYCKKEMTRGSVQQDRYSLKWVAAKDSKGLLNFTPFVKGILLTPPTSTALKMYYCPDCRKFVVDQDDLEF